MLAQPARTDRRIALVSFSTNPPFNGLTARVERILTNEDAFRATASIANWRVVGKVRLWPDSRLPATINPPLRTFVRRGRLARHRATTIASGRPPPEFET